MHAQHFIGLNFVFGMEIKLIAFSESSPSANSRVDLSFFK